MANLIIWIKKLDYSSILDFHYVQFSLKIDFCKKIISSKIQNIVNRNFIDYCHPPHTYSCTTLILDPFKRIAFHIVDTWLAKIFSEGLEIVYFNSPLFRIKVFYCQVIPTFRQPWSLQQKFEAWIFEVKWWLLLIIIQCPNMSTIQN